MATCVSVYLVTQTCSVRQVSSPYSYILLESYVIWCQMVIQDYLPTYYLRITPLFYSLPSLSCRSCRNCLKKFESEILFHIQKMQTDDSQASLLYYLAGILKNKQSCA